MSEQMLNSFALIGLSEQKANETLKNDNISETLTALSRRGFTSEDINLFCAQMGLTGAQAVVDPIHLESIVRDNLNITAPRAMAVLNPLKINIKNFPEKLKPIYLEVRDFPSDTTNSSTHLIPFERVIYIERDDFKEQTDDKSFRRLTMKQRVGLRHTGYAIECTRCVKNESEIVELYANIYKVSEIDEKPKSFIHWVSSPLICEIRLFERLIDNKNPGHPNEVPNGFLSDCNNDSLTILKEALVDVSVKYAKPYDKFQFETLGYFSVDTDSSIGHLIFNRTVSLKESSGII